MPKPTTPRVAQLVAASPNVVRLDAFRPRLAEANTPRATCLTSKGEAALAFLMASTQVACLREAAARIGWPVAKNSYHAAVQMAEVLTRLAAEMAEAQPDLTRDWPLPGGAA